MSRVKRPTPSPILAAVLLALVEQASATPLTLATVPQGRGGREPAPNIIVSVDDSGSMGNAGMASLRAALTNAFSTTAVADDSIRLGFQAMWRCRGLSDNPFKNYGAACPDNRVKRFSGTHRSNFNTWVNSLLPSSMTPSHLMVKNAGEFMQTTGIHNPYASNPGVQETPLLACRKSFHIFMTDGGWNSEWSYGNNPTTAGNADGTTVTLPDGTVYDTSAADTQTRIYRDAFGGVANVDGGASTVSDYAFMFWATDLQPGIANNVRPIIRKPAAVNVGTAASPYMIQEYWNPENNPATWQSLTTYTIGFGAGAALDTAVVPRWGGSTWAGGDYTNLLTGAVAWGNPITNAGDPREKELWHMAINGRGKHISAANGAELSAAFAEIVNQILLDTSTPLVAISANTQSVRSDTQAYVAGYDANRWSGELNAYNITSSGGVSSTSVWNAAQQLNSATPATRRILTHNGTTATTFDWVNLSADQQLQLRNGDTDTVGQNRLNYLRGDRTLEQQATPPGTFRNRASRLGDIVNSAPWPVAKPNMGYAQTSYRAFRSGNSTRAGMVYVGANDGMLHGFATADGSEKLAYVPKGVYNTLATLPDPAYTHRYYVDGKPFTSDFHNGTAWRTALVGTLAGGGKGYFVLDVTNPSTFASTPPGNIVLLDNTDASPKTLPAGTTDTFDPDIGHMYSPPVQDSGNSAKVVQITKLNNGRWALLMGNGVNSTDEKAVLLIQYLDGTKGLVKITADATAGGGNGLSNPMVIDLNGDDKADVAYAGDLKGNLWKFDLTSASEASWGVAYGGTPLYVAMDSASARQPITTAPTWVNNPYGGLNLAFATGRDLTASDPASTTQQTLYAVWDNAVINLSGTTPTLSGGSAITTGRSALVQRTQTQTVAGTGVTFYKTSQDSSIVYTGTGAKRGWYFDYPVVGERTLNNPAILDKRLMLMPSIKPSVGSQTSSSEESCELNMTPVEQYLTILDVVTGKPYKYPLFDNDGGGFTGSETNGLSRMYTGSDPVSVMPKKGSSSAFKSDYTVVKARPGSTGNTGLRVLDDPAKVGWRHIQ